MAIHLAWLQEIRNSFISFTLLTPSYLRVMDAPDNLAGLSFCYEGDYADDSCPTFSY